MNLNPTEKNAIDVLTYIVETTGVKVTAKSVKEQLYLHPDFPSMLAFSDVLREWNIPAIATRVFREQLVEIPLPAIAYLEIKGGYFAPIRKVSSQEIEWLDTQEGWKKERLEEFYKKWNHVVLLLEPHENSQEPNYAEKRKGALLTNARKPFVFGGLLVCLLLFGSMYAPAFSPMNWPYFSLIATKLAGVSVSVVLLLYMLGTDNTLLRFICGFDSRTDCNNVLTSKAAKLRGWLGWADIGFVYFARGFLSLTLNLALANRSPDGEAFLKLIWVLGALRCLIRFGQFGISGGWLRLGVRCA